MGLADGPTLADRIEQGSIHRDLKPANMKLRPDGVVLDFGLRGQTPRNVVSILDSARELGIRDAQGVLIRPPGSAHAGPAAPLVPSTSDDGNGTRLGGVISESTPARTGRSTSEVVFQADGDRLVPDATELQVGIERRDRWLRHDTSTLAHCDAVRRRRPPHQPRKPISRARSPRPPWRTWSGTRSRVLRARLARRDVVIQPHASCFRRSSDLNRTQDPKNQIDLGPLFNQSLYLKGKGAHRCSM